jgi:hypothetical protein
MNEWTISALASPHALRGACDAERCGVGVRNASGRCLVPRGQGGAKTRTTETALILKIGRLTSPPSPGEHIVSSTTDSQVKEGIEKTAETLKHATKKVADAIKETAHHASEEMKEEEQKVKDAAR